MSGWIFLGFIVVLVLLAFGAYNRLVALGQRVNQAFADIDVQLKQRHDLIPNLVETVKGYGPRRPQRTRTHPPDCGTGHGTILCTHPITYTSLYN